MKFKIILSSLIVFLISHYISSLHLSNYRDKVIKSKTKMKNDDNTNKQVCNCEGSSSDEWKNTICLKSCDDYCNTDENVKQVCSDRCNRKLCSTDAEGNCDITNETGNKSSC